MHTFRQLSLATLFSILSAGIIRAEKNITIEDTDPSITFTDSKDDHSASLCRIDEDGNINSTLGPGCYYVLPQDCTDSASIIHGTGNGISSFKFYGSAIYVNALLINWSPLFNLTLDGQTISVDGVRDSLPFTCSAFFYQTGLDPSTEHELSIIVGDRSPNANATSADRISPGTWPLFLDNFIVTVPDDANGIKGPPSSSGSVTTPTSTEESASSTSTEEDAGSNDAAARLASSVSFAAGVMSVLGAVLV